MTIEQLPGLGSIACDGDERLAGEFRPEVASSLLDVAVPRTGTGGECRGSDVLGGDGLYVGFELALGGTEFCPCGFRGAAVRGGDRQSPEFVKRDALYVFVQPGKGDRCGCRAALAAVPHRAGVGVGVAAAAAG